MAFWSTQRIRFEHLRIFLEYGRETFLIWFSELDALTEDPYDGNHQNQDRITPKDRQRMSKKSHSPAALNGLAAIEPALSKILCDLLPNVVRSCRLKDPKHPELLPQSID
jgi:hypothetical protein